MSFLPFANRNDLTSIENFPSTQFEIFTKIFSHFSHTSHAEILLNTANFSIHLKKMMQDIAKGQDLLIKKMSLPSEVSLAQHPKRTS